MRLVKKAVRLLRRLKHSHRSSRSSHDAETATTTSTLTTDDIPARPDDEIIDNAWIIGDDDAQIISTPMPSPSPSPAISAADSKTRPEHSPVMSGENFEDSQPEQSFAQPEPREDTTTGAKPRDLYNFSDIDSSSSEPPQPKPAIRHKVFEEFFRKPRPPREPTPPLCEQYGPIPWRVTLLEKQKAAARGEPSTMKERFRAAGVRFTSSEHSEPSEAPRSPSPRSPSPTFSLGIHRSRVTSNHRSESGVSSFHSGSWTTDVPSARETTPSLRDRRSRTASSQRESSAAYSIDSGQKAASKASPRGVSGISMYDFVRPASSTESLSGEEVSWLQFIEDSWNALTENCPILRGPEPFELPKPTEYKGFPSHPGQSNLEQSNLEQSATELFTPEQPKPREFSLVPPKPEQSTPEKPTPGQSTSKQSTPNALDGNDGRRRRVRFVTEGNGEAAETRERALWTHALKTSSNRAGNGDLMSPSHKPSRLSTRKQVRNRLSMASLRSTVTKKLNKSKSVDTSDIPPDEVRRSPSKPKLGKRLSSIWARWPSHTKHARVGSARAYDGVIAHDWASNTNVNPSAQNENAKGLPRKLKEPAASKKREGLAKSKSNGFLKTIVNRYKNERSDTLRMQRGCRSSVAVGGNLENPDLELLPPV